MLLCIDIGNTHAHYGVVAHGQALFQRELPTRAIDHPSEGFGPVLAPQPDVVRSKLLRSTMTNASSAVRSTESCVND